MTTRQTWRQAGQKLRNVTDSRRASEPFTQDELDWMHILQERFFELANREAETPGNGIPR